ncbi:hypothetical protein PVAND_011820 [Polypedilum vanderplanki]|uniref:Uncharacterized protein n=1 Tax=Polypedilum vanderplanki TaxID=319348 RepID=A0A9J6CKJ0_POLVA|nr:hypothetical protein PVAND_011820 [Polypedilum vanderplanki]
MRLLDRFNTYFTQGIKLRKSFDVFYDFGLLFLFSSLFFCKEFIEKWEHTQENQKIFQNHARLVATTYEFTLRILVKQLKQLNICH